MTDGRDGSGAPTVYGIAMTRRRLGVAGVVVLVVTAGLTVVLSGGGAASAPNDSSHALRGDAAAQLQSTDRTELAAAVNRTLASYTDANHTREPPFETDRRVAAEAGPMVARSLARSDDVLATAAIRDVEMARRLLAAHGATYDEGRVRSLLRQARERRRAGRTARPDDPVAAIDAYATAWQRSREALALLDAAHDPRARIVTRADPSGGLGTDRTLTGTVSDVRLNGTEAVTVAVGNRTTTTRVVPARVPVTNGSFEVTVDVPTTPTTVAVYAGRSATGEPTDRLHLDGDGLPDTVERANASLDPLDPDTDGDGTTDGRERATRTRSAPLLNATVTATGQRRSVSAVTVGRADPGSSGRLIETRSVSPVVTVQGPDEVDNATVRLPYDDSTLANESAVQVYRRPDDGPFRAVPTTVDEANNTAVARTEGFSSFVALARSDDSGNGTDDGTNRYEEFFSRIDRPFDRELNGLVVHRELGPEGPQVLLYIQQADGFVPQPQRYTFGAIEFEDANVTSVRNGPRGLHPFEQQGDGRPEPGATTRNGGGDEVHVLDGGTRIDFASKNDPFKDAVAFRYNVTGPDPRMRVSFRRADGTEPVVRLGGDTTATVPAGQPIELPKLRDPDEDGLPTFIEEAGMITGDGRIIRTNATNNDTDGDGTPDGVEMGDPVFDDSAPVSPYFEPDSDPTDPNTDDVGLNDTQEYERGSDPAEPEKSLVYASIPMEVQNRGINEVQNNWRLVRSAATYTHTESTGLFSSDPDSVPNWVRFAHEAPGTGDIPPRSSGASYALVDINVVMGVENTSTTPFDVTFETTSSNAEVVAVGTRPEYRDDNAFAFSGSYAGIREGGTPLSVVIKADDDGANIHEVGTLRMKIRRPNETEFYRPRLDTRRTIDGEDYVISTVTSDREYAFKNFGADDVLRLYDKSLGLVTSTAVSAVTLSVGGQTGRSAQILISSGSAGAGTAIGGALFVESVSTACTATNEDSTVPELAKDACTNEPPAESPEGTVGATPEAEPEVGKRSASSFSTKSGLRVRKTVNTATGEVVERTERITVGLAQLRWN